MAQRTKDVNLDAWFGDSNKGNGNGNKMSVGKGTGDWAWVNRFAIQIARGDFFDGIPSAAAITGFVVWLKTNSGNTGIGSAVKFWLERGTTSFTELTVTAGSGGVPAGANISAYVSSAGPSTGHYPGPTTTSTDRGDFEGSPAADKWISVNLLALGKWWFAHPEVTNLVLVASAKDETATNQRCTFYTLQSGSHPYAQITYGGNSPPNKPTEVTVVPSGSGFTISARYSDPDGDPSPRFEILYSPTLDA